MIKQLSDSISVRSKSPLIVLSIAESDRGIRSFEIKDLPALVGRSHAGEIVLDDPHVSRKHCVIAYADGQVVLQDLDSAQGTFVNGQPIRKCPLAEGDLIRLGKNTSLRVIEIGDAKRFQQATWNLSRNSSGNEVITPARIPTLRAKLSVRTLGHTSCVVSVENLPFLIGRQAGADLSLDDRFASSSHCLLNQIRDYLVVQDLESRNGTRVNGQFVHHARLREGDTIEIGTTCLTVLSVERTDRAEFSSGQLG